MICAIIGGGPAGLNAALMLARAKYKVVIFDQQRPRNAVTDAMHGFLTREGISPLKFRRLAQQELLQFEHVKQIKATIVGINKHSNGNFIIVDSQGKKVQVNKVILAMGLKEMLPSIKNIEKFYGSSIFSCMYCDGYEHANESLAIITEQNNAVLLAAMAQQWNKRVMVFTNGKAKLTISEKQLLEGMGVALYEQSIVQLAGQKGKLQGIHLADGGKVQCTAGLVSTYWQHTNRLAEKLGCKFNERGGIWQDGHGRTNITGIYVAGDASNVSPAQAAIAASDGVKAAISLNQDVAQQRLMKAASKLRSKEKELVTR